MLLFRTKLFSISHVNWQRRSFSSYKTQQIYVWGRGDHGQLGLGDKLTLCVKPHFLDLSSVMQKHDFVEKVVCGMNHTVITTNHGSLLSFGVGEHGELGFGDFKNRFTPSQILDLKNKSPIHVACGGHHTLCVTESTEGMQVFSWGKNLNGQLGHPMTYGISRPQEIVSLRGKPVTAVAAGDEFSVVATSQEVMVFGRLDVGQNGRGDQQNNPFATISLHNVVKLSCGWGHTLALTKDGDVWSWGANLHSQCGTGLKSVMSSLKKLTISNIADIACGSCHSMLLSVDGRVWIFGSAADGKMLESTTDVLEPRLIPHHSLGRAVSIASGSDHLAVLQADGVLKLWGFGQHGVLGTGELDIYNYPQVVRSPLGSFSSIACGMDTTIATAISENPFPNK